MFRATSAHLQENTVVYMQHMVLSVMCTTACVQLYPPEDEHLSLETFRGK